MANIMPFIDGLWTGGDLPAGEEIASPQERTYLANISQVTDRIWTGGDLPDNDAARQHILDWEAAGIGVIVDNRLEWNDEALVAAFRPGIRYLHNGVDDAGGRQPDCWFDAAVDFAQRALDETGTGVLLHCHMGINRGPSAAYAVLLAEGWNPVDAIDLIRARRPIAAVGYAEDALDWWHRRTCANATRRAHETTGLATWRDANPHDTVRIIRAIRAGEAA